MSVRPMTATPLSEGRDVLRRRLGRDGFLYLPSLLPRVSVLEVRGAIRDELSGSGWLASGRTCDDLVPRNSARHGAPGWWRMYQRLQALERFHALAYTSALVGVVGQVIGGRVLNHPRRQVTMTSPGFWIPPHQEHLHIQGTADVLTAWVPLVPLGPGEGLQVLAEDAARRLRPVVRDRHDGVRIPLRSEEGTWWAAERGFRLGDVVLVHAIAIRRTMRHNGPGLLLSVEFRYQPAFEPVTKGALLPQHYPRLPGWNQLTRGWSSKRWLRTPLIMHVVPYVMPSRIEQWHRLLPKPSSTIVRVADDAGDEDIRPMP